MAFCRRKNDSLAFEEGSYKIHTQTHVYLKNSCFPVEKDFLRLDTYLSIFFAEYLPRTGKKIYKIQGEEGPYRERCGMYETSMTVMEFPYIDFIQQVLM